MIEAKVLYVHVPFLLLRMIEIMNPYNPSTSPMIRMSIAPIISLGCSDIARAAASPATPMHIPGASPVSPTENPPARFAYPEKGE
jgi:hypothetical protein